jgi:hypothetical protein
MVKFYGKKDETIKNNNYETYTSFLIYILVL